MSKPSAHEIEVSVFSRSGGEAIAVHVGDGRWILIDSLNSASRRPATLEYLEQIGVSPDCVVGIVLTHWHDDHIEGAAELVRACTNAFVSIPLTLKRDEFYGFLEAIEPQGGEGYSSGVRELISVLEIVLDDRSQHPRWAISGRTLYTAASPAARLEALSPADADATSFIADIAKWLTAASKGGRLPPPSRNDAAIATVITVEGELLLFGADLEVSHADRGWHAVHQLSWGNRGQASFVKIPHHGSANAHYLPMWEDMLTPQAHAVLTPWNKKNKLPRPSDIERINALTPNGFTASQAFTRPAMKRMSTIEGMNRDAGIKLTRAPTDLGFVRMRKNIGSADEWRVECLGVGSQRLAA